MPLLDRLPEGERKEWPRVSVIITACNEEMALEKAVRARLEDDYPVLELRSAERATFTAIGNVSLSMLAVIAFLALGLELSPLLSLLLARTPATLTAAIGLLLLSLAAMIVNNRWLDRRSSNLILAPVAELIICYSQLRSGVLGRWRGGIIWRGTFYSNAELKAGRRFR